MDATGSMQQWIDIARDTVLDSFSTLQNENPTSIFHLACVCYRDFGDKEQFIIVPFTEDISIVQNTLKNTKALGGSDQPEDVAGALQKVLELDWNQDTFKIVLWVCDAPAHGNKYHLPIIDDRYPKGDPNGLEPSEQIKELYLKGIDFTMFRISNNIDKMVEVFSSIYNSNDIDEPTFTLLNLIKQSDHFNNITSGFIDLSTYDYDRYHYREEINNITSGFMDLSTYDCERYYYGSTEYKDIEDIEDISKKFCSSTVKSITQTIEKRKNKIEK